MLLRCGWLCAMYKEPDNAPRCEPIFERSVLSPCPPSTSRPQLQYYLQGASQPPVSSHLFVGAYLPNRTSNNPEGMPADALEPLTGRLGVGLKNVGCFADATTRVGKASGGCFSASCLHEGLDCDFA